MTRSIRMAILLGFSLAASPPARAGTGFQESTPVVAEERVIVLPEGPLAELLGPYVAPDMTLGIPMRVGPQGLWPIWGAQRDAIWETAIAGNNKGPWALWASLLQQLASVESDPRGHASLRTKLALLARFQGRDQAGWRHLLASGDSDAIAWAMPTFLPGILRRDHLIAPFDGTYRPALPPPSNPFDPNALATLGNSMEHRAVHLGESVFSMKVQLEGDGIQVDLTHVSGPEVSFKVLPPEPEGLRIALLYADWVKVGTERQAVPVKLAPGDPTFTIWGRFLTREENSPIPRGGGLPPKNALRPDASIRLLVAEPLTQDPFLLALASFVARLTKLPVELASAQAPVNPRFPESIDIHLGQGAALDKKVLELIDRLEEWVLAEANLRLAQSK